MIRFTALHPRGLELLGYIPTFLSPEDPRPAKEQFDENYTHGGGLMPFRGFSLEKESMVLTYPSDDPMLPLAVATLRDERIFVYPHAWVLILQPDGTWEVSRMD